MTSTTTLAYQRVDPAPVAERAHQHMVRMRDGVRLATDVYLAGTEAAETVLIRLPYDKSGSESFIPLVADYFVRHGYHVVAQDVRGKFRSEGETLLFVNEAADGYDTLDWVVAQTWSNGIVGMWGDSYYGYTQWAAASTNHPALRAMSPKVTGTRLGELPRDSDGGVTRDVEMTIELLYPCMFFHSNPTYYWEPDWSRRPLVDNFEEFFRAVGSRSVSYDQWFPHQVRLRRFPFGHPFDAKPIPTLQSIGWWDNCAPWQWNDLDQLLQRGGWRHNTYLLLDSIDHESHHILAPGERSPEELAAMLPRYLDPTIEFFDIFLRNRGSADDLPRVRWNLAHTEGWRTADRWPPADVTPTSLPLRADGVLGGPAEVEVTALSWWHDPDDLVPSPVQNAFRALAEYPDERAWSDRDDVVVFDAPVAETDTDLVGPVSLKAQVHSSGPRMDLFARLLDVEPDGSAHLVARGQVHLIDSSRPTSVQVDLGHVGYRLRAGHHLRLHLASSDFPEFVPQPGTGENPWLAEVGVRNRQTLSVGGPDGAALHLSVLPPA